MRFVAVVAAILAPIAFTALADEVPGDRTSLIRLQSRVFDLGTDARQIRRDPSFIPVTRVDWIWNLTNTDPYLFATVIHIKSYAHFPAEPIWWPDENRAQFSPAPDLADAWALEEFDVRWRTKIAPTTRGDILLFPKSSTIDYYVSCGYDRKDRVPIFCAAHMLYPPDPSLRILVRIYRITDPLNDFAAIVGRALDLVRCLDVTRALDASAWTPSTSEPPTTLAEFLATCRNVAS